MDFRVGKIISCEKNPNSEKLYNEVVDIGGGVQRKIGSGLQKFLTLEQMNGAMVVVLCNLKEKKLADYMSHGMVMCAETPNQSEVQFLNPPEGSVPGDLIEFEGFPRSPPEALPMKKNNDPWGNVSKCLQVDEDGVGCYVDPESNAKAIFKTAKGICKSSTIKKGVIK